MFFSGGRFDLRHVSLVKVHSKCLVHGVVDQAATCTCIIKSMNLLVLNIYWKCSTCFWLIWFINQRALYNYALSIVVIGVVLCQCWHQHCCPCTPSPDTWLDIETLYLVYICTYVPHICTSNI